jgi:hypothetical protein
VVTQINGLIRLLKRSDKVYYQNDSWIVYLNNRNHTKVVCLNDSKIYDYFKDIYGKKTVVPKYVQEKCKEIHTMWHDGSIWTWMDSQKEKAKRKK